MRVGGILWGRRPPCGRARPSPLRIKKALVSKWYSAQTFFLGGTCPQSPRPIRAGALKMSLLPFGNPSTENLVLHPPTPYTLSPLLKGGEGRGEGGSYTHVPCLFGALLVTLYQIFSKGFLNGKGDMGGASPQRGLAPPE